MRVNHEILAFHDQQSRLLSKHPADGFDALKVCKAINKLGLQFK